MNQGNLFGGDKQHWIRLEYDQRKCEFPGCSEHPSFGYGPPFCPHPAWTCREHQTWFEESQNKPRVADTPEAPTDTDAWIDEVMESVRRRYAEATQPTVLAAAEAMRSGKAK